MKKTIAALSAVLLFCFTCAFAMHGEEIVINTRVNGVAVEFKDQRPVIIGGRVLLPIRGVTEAMGKTVSWDDTAKRAVITDGNITVSLAIGDSTMIKTTSEGTEDITLDTCPIIMNDRTCLPIRAVAEAFGATVNWDDDTKTVDINSL